MTDRPTSERSTGIPPPAPAADHSAEQLYEHAPCGYLSTSMDGTVVRANATLLRWLGLEAADLLGRRRFADLLPPGPRVLWETHGVPQLAAAGSVSGVALDLVRSDGTRLPTLAGAVLAAADDGSRVIRMSLFDATERRAYETGLVAARVQAERSESRLRALQSVTQACATATAPQELLDAVVSAAAVALDALGAAVWLRQPDSDELDLAAVLDLDEVLAPRHLPAGAPVPFAHAWRRGDVLAVETPEQLAEDFPLLSAPVRDAGAQAVLAVPLRYGEDRLGVLGVYLPHSRPVGDAELALQRTIGAQVGQALARTRMHAELERLALHDVLTGLPNRALLSDRTEQALARALRSGRPLAVLLLDLDGFKQVNDTLGHAAGDQLLRVTAGRLSGAVRDGDTVARLGGDEFAVLCEDASATVAEELAERIRTAVALPVELEGVAAGVTASVGVATWSPADTAAPPGERLLADADTAMYAAKRTGKDRHAVATGAAGRDGDAAVGRLLRRALDGRDGGADSGALVLHYQPVFDLRSGVVRGVEALCRLRTADGRLLPPAVFLPPAERQGLLVRLGATVLETACRRLADWLDQGLPQVQLAVNVAAEQAARPDFASAVLATLAATGCPAECLVLEVTESALLEASPTTIDGLGLLRGAGVGIALDDFGTRFASLHYVQKFPLTELKIDRSFVVGLSGRRTDAAIVTAVARLAADLDLVCVAEGIETRAQRDFLRGLGVRGQGFLLGRPVPAHEVVEHLLRAPLWS
jgi:diguanylate cyclase (GGDEF)-like protein